MPVIAGLVVGMLTVQAQSWVTMETAAFVDSGSIWLLAPFGIGALQTSRRADATTGMVCCALQVAGYDIAAGSGAATSWQWFLMALLSGPLFGLAGYIWRHGRPGLQGFGPAVLAATFITEGVLSWKQGPLFCHDRIPVDRHRCSHRPSNTPRTARLPLAIGGDPGWHGRLGHPHFQRSNMAHAPC